MIHSATAMLAHMEPGKVLDIRDEDGNCVLSKCPYEHVRYLVEAGVVTGRGSPSKIRYAVLVCSVEEADRIVMTGARANTSAKSGSVNSMASRSIVNQTIHGHKRTFKAWKFIRTDAFAFGSSRLHTVASKAL